MTAAPPSPREAQLTRLTRMSAAEQRRLLALGYTFSLFGAVIVPGRRAA